MPNIYKVLEIISVNPRFAKVEDAADSRRRGYSRSSLLQTLGNTEDAVSSAFPKGKQLDVFWVSLDVTAGDIQSECQKWRRALLFLSFHTFRRVVYATVGFTLFCHNLAAGEMGMFLILAAWMHA